MDMLVIFYGFFGLPRCQFVALPFFGAKLRAGFWPRLRVRNLPIISWNFACQWRCKAQMIFDVRWRQSKQRQKTTRGTRFKISCSGCGSKLEFFEVKAAVPFENCWARGMANRHRRKSTRTATNQSNRRRNCEVRLCLHLVRFYDSETLRIYIARLPLNPMVDHQPYVQVKFPLLTTATPFLSTLTWSHTHFHFITLPLKRRPQKLGNFPVL